MNLSNFFKKFSIVKISVGSIIVQVILFLIFFTWSYFFIKDTMLVPFHPDEATQIFMSTDFDKIISGNVEDLFYDESKVGQPTQNYRLLDSPITRYLIGFSRSISKTRGLNSDWDWAKSWIENQNALPNISLLFISRIGIAILLPIAILLFFYLVKSTFNLSIAIVSSLLLMSNSLILLHTRRAMAESGVIFFLILSLFVLIKTPNKYLFVLSIPIGLGINSKQILFPLVFVGIMFIILKTKHRIKNMLAQLILFLVLLFAIIYILNPVLWKNPVQGIIAMITHRSELTNNQIDAIGEIAPTYILNNPIERIVGIFGQVFIVKPAIEDVSNYEKDQRGQKSTYNQNLFHRGLGRNLIAGTINFFVTIFGLYLIILNREPNKRIFIGTFFLFVIELILFFPIPFQRYYILLVPFTIVFLSNGLFNGFLYLKNIIRKYQNKKI